MSDIKLKKCQWPLGSDIMENYHDNEWGIPLHDDTKLFEFLVMESMQCGLSWMTVMKKREALREAFSYYDWNKVALYTEEDITKAMEVPNMLKSPRKIKAIINNAQCYKKIADEFGSFDEYLWAYTGGKVFTYKSHENLMPAQNELSEKIAADLKKRGFKYLGPVTVYSYIQSCGLINDHSPECYLYKEICDKYPVEFIEDGV